MLFLPKKKVLSIYVKIVFYFFQLEDQKIFRYNKGNDKCKKAVVLSHNYGHNILNFFPFINVLDATMKAAVSESEAKTFRYESLIIISTNIKLFLKRQLKTFENKNVSKAKSGIAVNISIFS